MPTFAYIGTAADGNDARGTVIAQNADEAREKLRKKGVTAEHLELAVTFLQNSAPVPEPSQAPAPAATAPLEREYLPLVDTLRLYAGWLMAWYVAVYLLGSYQLTKRLPFEIPFIQGLFQSTIVLNFAFGTFLFLLLSSVHRTLGRGLWKGIGLSIVWIVGVALFVVNA